MKKGKKENLRPHSLTQLHNGTATFKMEKTPPHLCNVIAPSSFHHLHPQLVEFPVKVVFFKKNKIKNKNSQSNLMLKIFIKIVYQYNFKFSFIILLIFCFKITIIDLNLKL